MVQAWSCINYSLLRLYKPRIKPGRPRTYPKYVNAINVTIPKHQCSYLSIKEKMRAFLPNIPFIFLLVSIFHHSAWAKELSPKVKIVGIKGDLKKNVELSIGTPFINSEKAIRSYLNKLESLTKKSLQTKGYYNSKIKVQQNIEHTKKRSTNIIQIEINSGPQVRIRSLRIQIQGDAESDVVFRKLIRSMPIYIGDPLDHGVYEEAKKSFLEAAQDRGYFDAQFTRKTVTVDDILNRADIDLTFDSGSRYKIGAIELDSDIFSREFLERWIPFKSGIPYESKLITDLTRQFQGSGYFSHVRVQTLYDRSVHAVVPIKITLRATERNKIGVGFGFATDTGPRAKLTWRRPHHNQYGHSLDLTTGISDIRQESTLQYKVPKKNRPLTDYWLTDLGALNEHSQDARSQLRTLNFQRIRETNSRWKESVFIRWEHEKFEAANESHTINLVLPGISWSRIRTKGGIDPSFGNQFSLQFMGANTNFFSDIDVLKSVVSLKWLSTLFQAHKMILRLDYGAISTNDFDRLPTSHRFYVGGDQSVRGFRYNTISPENDDGELTGGRFKEVASMEYNYRFKENWSAALFLDAGRAFDHFDERYRVGTGFGVRWHSPVGPLRLDLGFGISETDIPILFHLSIGPDI